MGVGNGKRGVGENGVRWMQKRPCGNFSDLEFGNSPTDSFHKLSIDKCSQKMRMKPLTIKLRNLKDTNTVAEITFLFLDLSFIKVLRDQLKRHS